MPNALSKSGRSIIVVVNSRSGPSHDRDIAGKICTAFSDHGLDVEVRLCSRGESIKEIARQGIRDGFSTIVAGGGDGTISAVASEVAGSDAALGVIPLGTLNHFAQDAGISLDMNEAVATIAEGHRRDVDVGEVNGRIFVNNSSLGLYPHFVRHRRNQRRLGRGRWSALAQALWTVIGRYPFLYVHVSTDGRDVVTRTPLVFIGNNEYTVQGLQIGKRISLSEGRLSLYMTRQVGAVGFFRLALRALVGLLRTAKDFVAAQVSELRIECNRTSVHVALDGEVVRMEPPLHYRCRPQALTLIAPRKEKEEEGEKEE